MSGSAANASARRRRANSQEQVNNIRQVDSTKDENQEKRGLTPLQILQSHEYRIKELETKTSQTTISNNFEISKSNELERKPDSTIEKSILEDLEKKFNKNVENIENVSNNQIDIEKKLTGELSKLNEKIDILVKENISLKNEVEELKDIRLMMIKSQTLGIETSNKLLNK